MGMYSEVIRGEIHARRRDVRTILHAKYRVYQNDNLLCIVYLHEKDGVYKASHFFSDVVMSSKQIKDIGRVVKDINKCYKELKNA